MGKCERSVPCTFSKVQHHDDVDNTCWLSPFRTIFFQFFSLSSLWRKPNERVFFFFSLLSCDSSQTATLSVDACRVKQNQAQVTWSSVSRAPKQIFVARMPLEVCQMSIDVPEKGKKKGLFIISHMCPTSVGKSDTVQHYVMSPGLLSNHLPTLTSILKRTQSSFWIKISAPSGSKVWALF